MVAGVAITPNVDNLIVTIDGVLQHPTDAYTISGSILTFDSGPAAGVDFHVIIMGQSSTVGEGSIGADELQVSGDGTNNQLLKSDGDGTMSWINQNTVTASTAATLATARTIGGTSFNGSANIAVALAATATTLATTRAINGVNFDGSAAITVTADANTLSNTTLKSTVVTSSLTSVGTITSGAWTSSTKVASAYLDDDTAHLSTTQTFTGLKSFSLGSAHRVRITCTASDAAGIELYSGHGNWSIVNSNTVADTLEFTDVSASAIRMVIGNTGKVGIGITAPQRILDVKGTSAQPVSGILRVLGTSEYAIEMGAHSSSPWGTWIQSGYYVNGAGTYTSAGNLNLNPSGGNVGIGTSSPGHELEISAGTHPQIHISETTNGSNLRLYQTDNVASIFTGKNGAYSTSIELTTQASSGATAVRLAIVGDKVGIGTTSPQTPLHIAGVFSAGDGVSTASTDRYGASQPTIAHTPGTITSDGGTLRLWGVGGGNAEGNGAQLFFGGQFRTAGNPDAGFAKICGIKESATGTETYSGALTFYTRVHGYSHVERMRISSDGKVGIGVTNPDLGQLYVFNDSTTMTAYIQNNQGDGHCLTLKASASDESASENMFKCATDSASRFEVMNSGKVTVNNSQVHAGASDQRVKKNITTMTNVLDDINKLRGVTFNWRESVESLRWNNPDDIDKQYGMIAQEVEEVWSELVSADDNGIKNISYEPIVAILLQGMKELSAKVEALENA